MEEKRHFGRVVFGTSAILEAGGRRLQEEILDISLKGALISMKEPAAVALFDPCRLIVPLSEEVTMLFGARVVHVEDTRMGVEFIEADTESIGHLRRLLELNTGDSEQVERELFFLARIL